MTDEMIGRKFGRLTVIRLATPEEKTAAAKGAYYLCKCDCGNDFIARGATLRNGATKSCGCLVRENGRHRKRETVNNDNFKEIMHKYEKVKRALCEEHDRKCLTTKCPLAKFACYEFVTMAELYTSTGHNAKPALIDAIYMAAEKHGVEL